MEQAKQHETANAEEAISIFRAAARLNIEDPFRKGNVIHLPSYGQAVMTGDLHGHEKNFEKLQKYAMLDRTPARHVVLHEMVHTDLVARTDVDTSHALLLKAADYKCAFPDQVHFLQSNHELAQLTGYLIAKNGRIVIDEFNIAVRSAYGEKAGEAVLGAINEFIASFPIAVRAPNRIWMSHSLPNAHDMDEFDFGAFGADRRPEETARSRTVFHLVWGRRHTQEQIDALARAFDVDVFLVGHQPQEMGYTVVHERILILASNHNHGTFLPFDLAKPRTLEELVMSIRKFVEVA